MSQRKTPKPKPASTPKPRYRYQGMGLLRDISRAVDEAMKKAREEHAA